MSLIVSFPEPVEELAPYIFENINSAFLDGESVRFRAESFKLRNLPSMVCLVVYMQSQFIDTYLMIGIPVQDA